MIILTNTEIITPRHFNVSMLRAINFDPMCQSKLDSESGIHFIHALNGEISLLALATLVALGLWGRLCLLM